MKKILTVDELRECLGNACLSSLSDAMFDKLILLLPEMDINLVGKALKEITGIKELCLNIIKRLNISCQNRLDNGIDDSEAKSYQQSLDALEFMIRNNSASFEDQEFCHKEMNKLAKKLNISDPIGFSDEIAKSIGSVMGLTMLIGGMILGGNVD